MVKCVVVADDLTGANATGVLLKKQGYTTSTILNLKLSSKMQLNRMINLIRCFPV